MMKSVLLPLLFVSSALATQPPNVVLILADNLGHGDIACLNPATKHRTPHLDQMSREGRTFSSCYSASGVCTPSRAALMTGCYPRRLNLHQSENGGPVLQPVATKGLHPDEQTLAELLRAQDYATICIGKWHLGDQAAFLPTRQGFDHFFGIPYSDDMTRDKRPDTWPELPLMRDEQVIEAPVDRDLLTQRYTAEAVKFIAEHRSQPFFLYLPHAMPGSTSDPFASPRFKGKSANGHYGDSVEEMDASTGEILAALKQHSLEGNTLVIFTSDNGAVRRNPAQGSNAPFLGMGYSTDEGAQRMPCIMRWPGRIPAGTTCDQIITLMDLLPSISTLCGAAKPEREIDGADATGLILGRPEAVSAYDERGFFYYNRDQLQAVRAGDWKLYLPLKAKRTVGKAKVTSTDLRLIDVQHDLAEEHDQAKAKPALVQRLLGLAEQARTILGDEERIGTGQRKAGSVDRAMGQKL